MNQQPLRILIVDDDHHMTRTLADILALSGYEAFEAWSGLEALEKARAMDFDCVLTDIKMPDLNGVELHSKLREAQPGLPVVMMTAYAADGLIHRGLEDGAVGVFDKPINLNHLLAFFASLAKNRMIVIVDDDPAFCRTLNHVLQMRGFKISEITDPHTGVEQIAADAQVILLDMKLNNITGKDLLKDIRQKYASLPVILITGYREEMAAEIQSALDNASACLYKPLEISRLLNILAEIQVKRLRNLLNRA